MTKTHQARDSLAKETPINPRTGRVWTLVDHEVSDQVSAVELALGTKEKARKFLQESGLITRTGKLPKRYGG